MKFLVVVLQPLAKPAVRPVPAMAQQRARSSALLHPPVWPRRLSRVCADGGPPVASLLLAGGDMIYRPRISWVVAMKSHGVVPLAQVGHAGWSDRNQFVCVCLWELWSPRRSCCNQVPSPLVALMPTVLPE